MRDLDAQIGVRVAHVLQKGIVLLTDPRFLVVACDIMPMDSVVVEVVEHGQACLLGSSLLQFAVVGLGLADSSVLGPIVLLAVGGGRELLQLSGPEPSVDVGGLQVGTLAATEIALPSAGPNVFYLRER